MGGPWARFTPFSGANSRPRKRLHRTVFRAWLLSKQERKKRRFLGRGQRQNGSRPGAEQAPKTRLGFRLGRAGLDSACFAAGLLWNQEPIQGPKNGSIARFGGLCCYQSRSEKNGDFRGAGSGKTVRGPALNRLRKRGLGSGWAAPGWIPPALLLACSGIRSKFKASKMALSHGFSGFAAIKKGAK